MTGPSTRAWPRLLAAARGNSDPELVISAVLHALGSTDPEDDTCLVALQVIGGTG